MESVTAFVRHEARLGAPHPGGGTLRAHLERARRQSKRPPAGLIGPPLPAGAGLVWGLFLDLHASRQWSEAGPQAIALRDLEAYCRLYGVTLARADLILLRLMDATFRNSQRDTPARDADDDWSTD